MYFLKGCNVTHMKPLEIISSFFFSFHLSYYVSLLINSAGGCVRAASPWRTGYQVLSDINFVQTWPDSECSHTVQFLDCSDLNWRCNHYHLFWHGMTLLVLMCRKTVIPSSSSSSSIVLVSLLNLPPTLNRVWFYSILRGYGINAFVWLTHLSWLSERFWLVW